VELISAVLGTEIPAIIRVARWRIGAIVMSERDI
jgi:hypothetical protein